MLSSIVAWFVSLLYLSLVAELVFIPVPSVVSTYQLFGLGDNSAFQQDVPSDIQRLRALSLAQKILIFLLPAVLNITVFMLPLYLAWFPDHIGYFWPLYIDFPGRIGLAIACLVLGRCITVLSALRIRRSNRQEDQSFHLHTTGLFGKSRNPGLLGMYIFIGGLWLLFPSALLLLGIVFYVAYMHFKVRLEESFLSHKFGSIYEQYLQQTPRYIGL